MHLCENSVELCLGMELLANRFCIHLIWVHNARLFSKIAAMNGLPHTKKTHRYYILLFPWTFGIVQFSNFCQTRRWYLIVLISFTFFQCFSDRSKPIRSLLFLAGCKSGCFLPIGLHSLPSIHFSLWVSKGSLGTPCQICYFKDEEIAESHGGQTRRASARAVVHWFTQWRLILRVS